MEETLTYKERLEELNNLPSISDENIYAIGDIVNSNTHNQLMAVSAIVNGNVWCRYFKESTLYGDFYNQGDLIKNQV